MMYYIISIIFFSIVFVYFPVAQLSWSHQVFETWLWDKSGGYGTKPDPISENPIDTLSGYKYKNKFFSFPSGRFYQVSEGKLLEYSILDEGYFEYKKLGDEVSYYNGWKELFWKKPYSSYPRPGYFSSILPLVSGDGNTVFFADRNGNPSATPSVDGRFATDICFSVEVDHTLVLFSGGEYFLLNGKGEILKQYESAKVENHSDTYFAKSCSISPNGDKFAIHHQQGQEDKIVIYDSKGKEYEFSLDTIYPHKLHFVLNNHSEILIANQNSVKLLSDRGKLIHSKENLPMNTYYNPVLALGDFFLWGSNESMNVWNREGVTIYEKKLPQNNQPLRFLPGKIPNTFYVETKENIKQISIF
ncbi:MAG: hypothetical protein JJT78_08010 [Leptospira sp.]|nr:hypothetical protein [Leptospira sp.]